MKRLWLLLALALLAGVGFAVYLVQSFWAPEVVAELSLHGWIAMGLGVVLTMALAAGLMSLVFFSSQRGYDEDAHRPDPDDDTP